MEQKNNSAKFAFFYLLSLVALLFMSLSSGIIIFQIINKNIADAVNQFKGAYNPNLLKFGISALLVSAPVYFFIARQIYKNLFTGALAVDSSIRKWLTYFILFVSSVVMIGWLIAVVNNFLDGELTTKVILKAMTAIGLATAIFTFYLHDIKRARAAGEKDRLISIYFFAAAAAVILIFIAGLFFVESPRETRDRRLDNLIINDFEAIRGWINNYYNQNGRLPENLDIITGLGYFSERNLKDPETGRSYDYKIIDENSFELCAEFRRSSSEDEASYVYYRHSWPHGAGYQCLKQRTELYEKGPIRIRDLMTEDE